VGATCSRVVHAPRWVLSPPLAPDVTPSEMKASYYNTVDQIYHVRWTAEKLARFEHLRNLIQRLWPQGHPTKLVQVGGTSGKGSVCRYLEAGLSARWRTGAMISPHIFDYRERFLVGGQIAAERDIVEIWEERLRPLSVELAISDPRRVPTFSELYILIALCLFEMHSTQLGIIETGIGGRYDQTTALDVVATVLTNVGEDHEELLGEHRWQRALDKAGIARANVPLFTSERESEALEVISGICRSTGSPLHILSEAKIDAVRALIEGADMGERALLSGPHQVVNAALAMMVIENLQPQCDQREVMRKLRDLAWTGRFWKVADGIYADVAHNVNKIDALLEEVVARLRHYSKIVYVIGLSGKRSAKSVFSRLHESADGIVVTSASYKGVDPIRVYEDLMALNEESSHNTEIRLEPDPSRALNEAMSLRGDDGVVVITGSTYLVDQLLNPDPYLKHINASYGWRTKDKGRDTR
jgi:dihydrofolate synthase / folylpolyglutamate synthase